MAENESYDTEISSAVSNHNGLSDDRSRNFGKNTELIADQKDRQSLDIDHTQSLNSSTYADCEENNTSISEGQTEVKHEEVSDVNNKHDVEGGIIENNTVHDDKINETENSTLIHETYKAIHNGSENITSEAHRSNKKNKNERSDKDKHPESEGDYDHIIDLESSEGEAYEDGDSADEHGSHCGSNSQENDRENGNCDEVNEDNATLQKKLDDDEDRRNPQYIPKRGFFYEHDDRTAGTGSEDETNLKKEGVQEPEPKIRGKRIPDGRWQHDRYREDEQIAKSSKELIEMYGYDIRNEESAPKARRRRKYGRGPNRYIRKWDDEEAYGKQIPSKRSPRHQKLPVHRAEYDAEFPAINNRKSDRNARSRERRKTPPSRYVSTRERSKSDNESKFKDERRRTPPRKLSSDRPEKTRNFAKRLSGSKEKSQNTETLQPIDNKMKISPKVMRKQFVIKNSVGRGRGRGIGKTLRYSNTSHDVEPRQFQGSRTNMQFIPGNRGRAKRLERPAQYFSSSKFVADNDICDLNDQLAAIDLSKRHTNFRSSKDDSERKVMQNEQSQEQASATFASPAIRSKRYSQQRHRLLPDSSTDKSAANINLHTIPNVQPVSHSIQNMIPQTDMCQSVTPTHTSMALMSQPPPQNVASPLSVDAASIPSSSLAVSASLIPLNAPPLTASGASLSAAAPPLPIMGFFQHPQGYTNQGTAAQLYTRDQSVINGPGSQPVQLVAFLPATPMMSNANHAQTAPPPPPPPPASAFSTTVMNYPQASQTQQTQPSFNADSYAMPPVTLAPIHQPPEMFQSCGGVTYYNTRSQVKPRSPPPPRVKAAIPIVPPPNETMK